MYRVGIPSGASLSGEMQGCRVRSAGTAHRQLEWDARIQSRFFGQGGQPGIGDGRGVKQPDLHASTQGPLGIRHGKPGGVVCRGPSRTITQSGCMATPAVLAPRVPTSS